MTFFSILRNPAHAVPVSQPVPYERFGFSWGAVFAGLGTAIALDVLFAEIALSLNLGIIDRSSDVGAIVVLNALFWVVTGLVSLFAGAWVAGRMANARTGTEGALHGVAVWGAGAVAMLIMGLTSAGVVAGGMFGVIGKGLEGAGKVAEIAAPTWEGIRGELSTALEKQDESVGARAVEPRDASTGGEVASGSGSTTVRDRSRLLALAGRHFAVDGEQLERGERDELVQLVGAQLGLSQPAAERTLAQWESVWSEAVQKYEGAKQVAAQKADEARRLAMAAAGWAALAMLFGLITAFFGGAFGTESRRQQLEAIQVAFTGSSKPLPSDSARWSGEAHPRPGV